VYFLTLANKRSECFCPKSQYYTTKKKRWPQPHAHLLQTKTEGSSEGKSESKLIHSRTTKGGFFTFSPQCGGCIRIQKHTHGRETKRGCCMHAVAAFFLRAFACTKIWEIEKRVWLTARRRRINNLQVRRVRLILFKSEALISVFFHRLA